MVGTTLVYGKTCWKGIFSRREVDYLGDLVSNSDRRNIVLAIVVAIVDISEVGSEWRSAMPGLCTH